MLGEFLTLARCSTLWEWERWNLFLSKPVYRECGWDESKMLPPITDTAGVPRIKHLITSHLFSCLFSEGFGGIRGGVWLAVLEKASLDIIMLDHRKAQILVVFSGSVCDWLHGAWHSRQGFLPLMADGPSSHSSPGQNKHWVPQTATMCTKCPLYGAELEYWKQDAAWWAPLGRSFCCPASCRFF